MAQSSRQRRKARRRTEATAETPPVAAAEPKRSEVKNQAVRDSLKPLAKGERPTAVTVGAVVAVLMGIANVVSGFLTPQGSAGVGQLVFSALLLVVAWGMWNARYWAVLSMQAVLGIIIVVNAIVVLAFANLLGVAIGIALIIPAGILFFHLVKAMARIQMPERS